MHSSRLTGRSNSEVMTLWRCTNTFIVIDRWTTAVKLRQQWLMVVRAWCHQIIPVVVGDWLACLPV